MKLSLTQSIAVASFAMLAAAGAKAESYEGVQQSVSAKTRAEVNEEAMRAAAAPNQNVTRGSRGPETVKPMADPARVYNDAVAAAAAPDQNVVSGSRVNSKVISTMRNPALAAAQGK